MSRPAFPKNPVVRALSCLMVAGALPAAYAQAPAAGAAESTPDTVVITARKWLERAIDAPLSVTVVGAEEIKDRGAIRISEVAVPNVSFLGGENNALPNFSVRGVQAQNRANVGFDSGIGVYVDGVFMGRTAAFNQETFDIERVEFLRGPQGTLFGKNSVAGAISMTTRDPAKRFTATGSLDIGSDSQRRLSAYLSSPLGSEAVRGSIAAYSGQREGYVRNAATNTSGGNEDAQSVRAKVLLTPSKGLSVTLALDSLRDRSVAASPAIESGYGAINGGPYVSNSDLPTSAARNVSGAGMTVQYELGGGLTLTSITSKRKLDTSRTSDTDVGPSNIVASSSTSRQDQWSQELRIATGRDKAVSYVAGLYYYDQSVAGTSISTFGPAAPVFAPIRNTTGNTFGNIDTTSAAVFANADWNVSRALTLTGGLRYTSEKKKLAYQQVVTFPAFLAPSIPLENDSLSTNDLSPLVAARWRIDRDSMVYASYSRGFRSGGWNVDNVTTGGPTSFKQTRFNDERITNYEIGFKASALARKLTVALTAFRMDYADMQLTQQVAVLGGGGATVGLVTNGGQSRSEGAELELTMRPTASLRLGATVGYTDARYTNYVDTRAGTTLSFTGNRLNFSPRMTSTLSAVYTMAVPMGALALRGDYSFVDSYFTGRENLATQVIPQRELVNLRATLSADRWEVAAYVNNALDKRYVVTQGSGGFAPPVGAGTNRVADYGRARTWGLVGTLSF